MLNLVPVTPSRDEARAWAERELSRAIYDHGQASIWERVNTWIAELEVRIGNALSLLIGSGPRASWGLAIVVLVVLTALALLVWRVGGVRSRRAGAAPRIFPDQALSAREYRDLAEQAAAAEDWAGAVTNSFRALVRDGEERHVLQPRLSRTADEAANDLAESVPVLRTQAQAAARVFDEVLYGDRPADATQYELVRNCEAAFRRLRPGGGAATGDDAGAIHSLGAGRS